MRIQHKVSLSILLLCLLMPAVRQSTVHAGKPPPPPPPPSHEEQHTLPSLESLPPDFHETLHESPINTNPSSAPTSISIAVLDSPFYQGTNPQSLGHSGAADVVGNSLFNTFISSPSVKVLDYSLQTQQAIAQEAAMYESGRIDPSSTGGVCPGSNAPKPDYYVSSTVHVSGTMGSGNEVYKITSSIMDSHGNTVATDVVMGTVNGDTSSTDLLQQAGNNVSSLVQSMVSEQLGK